MRITYVGHATVLIETEGMRFLTDPVLRRRIGHLRRYGLTPQEQMTANLDAALISHLHADHLDRRSLTRLAAETAIVAPRGSRNLIEGWVSRPVQELGVGESLDMIALEGEESARIRATRADHDSRRRPFGPTAPAVGYEISIGGRRIYFAGDTDVHAEMGELAGSGDLDIALLPVWGWGPSLGPGHMDPDAAARAVALLKPRLAIPIHWGTLFPLGMGRWMAHHLREPPLRFAAQVAKSSPGTEVAVLAPGESITL